MDYLMDRTPMSDALLAGLVLLGVVLALMV